MEFFFQKGIISFPNLPSQKNPQNMRMLTLKTSLMLPRSKKFQKKQKIKIFQIWREGSLAWETKFFLMGGQ